MKNYRRRFIFYAMLVFVSTMLIVGGIINVADYVTTQQWLDESAQMMRSHNDPDEEMLDYFHRMEVDHAIESRYDMLRNTIAIILVCSIAVYILLCLVADKAMQPFVENAERQKRFITDASHELKTPLGIIMADVGVMELTHGEDEWTRSIKGQVSRMDGLIHDMLELARSEEQLSAERFDELIFSELVEKSVHEFETEAQQKDKTLEVQLQPNVELYGDAGYLTRLVNVLLENALKYCDEQGTISVRLSRRGRHAVLAISNPCSNMDASRLPQLFERFYRPDEARTREHGGYGIGLALARNIVQKHSGTLEATYEQGIFTIFVNLPAAFK